MKAYLYMKKKKKVYIIGEYHPENLHQLLMKLTPRNLKNKREAEDIIFAFIDSILLPGEFVKAHYKPKRYLNLLLKKHKNPIIIREGTSTTTLGLEVIDEDEKDYYTYLRGIEHSKVPIYIMENPYLVEIGGDMSEEMFTNAHKEEENKPFEEIQREERKDIRIKEREKHMINNIHKILDREKADAYIIIVGNRHVDNIYKELSKRKDVDIRVKRYKFTTHSFKWLLKRYSRFLKMKRG